MVSALAEAVADVVDRTDRAEVTDLADLEDVVDRGDVAAPPPLVDDAKALLALLVAVPDVDDRTDRDEVLDRGDVGVVDNPFFGGAGLLTAFFSTSSSFCCGEGRQRLHAGSVSIATTSTPTNSPIPVCTVRSC